MEQLLVEPGRAAELISVSRAQMYQMIARKEIKSVRVGTRIRVPTEALKEWVQKLAEPKEV